MQPGESVSFSRLCGRFPGPLKEAVRVDINLQFYAPRRGERIEPAAQHLLKGHAGLGLYQQAKTVLAAEHGQGRRRRSEHLDAVPFGGRAAKPLGIAPDPAGFDPDDDSLDATRIGVDDYVAAEVQPHATDAWVDHDKTKIGYEIPFTRIFYRYTPPRPLAEIDADIKAVEAEILALLTEVTE